jgi:cell division inhibitor SepF
MLRMFKKAGDAVKRVLLTGGEDVYNDEYYEEDGYYDDGYEDDPMQEHYSHGGPAARKAAEKPAKTRSFYADKIVELGYSAAAQTQQSPYMNQPVMPAAVIAHPKEIKDASKLCDDICNGKMVIVDLSSLDSVNAQRIADYLGGVVHTIQGNTTRVNKGIFVISPKEYEVSNSSNEDIPSTRDYGAFRAISR